MPLAMNLVRDHMMRTATDTLTAESDELLETLNAINKALDIDLTIMLESYQQASEERVRVSERMATLGQLSAGISQELKNPIGVINTATLLLEELAASSRDVIDSDRFNQTLARIKRGSRQVAELANQLIEYARIKSPSLQPCPARAVIDEALSLSGEYPTVDISSSVTPPDVIIECDPADLARAIANLTRNAAQSIEESGRPGEVRVDVIARADDVQIAISDNGPGIKLSLQSQIFEPLFSSRPRGTGLGLPIARELVDSHQGQLVLDSREGEGCTFTIHLPGAAKPAAPE